MMSFVRIISSPFGHRTVQFKNPHGQACRIRGAPRSMGPKVLGPGDKGPRTRRQFRHSTDERSGVYGRGAEGNYRADGPTRMRGKRALVATKVGKIVARRLR